MADAVTIGVDVGGTKIAAAALGPDGGMLAWERADTPRGDYEATLETICALVAAVERAAGIRAKVGVGIPGSVAPRTGRVQNANSTWLNGRAFDADLARQLARPVRVANDANSFALSEAADGAGAGAASVFGVILGTGCGGALVSAGRLIDGPRGIGGEWGHNPLPWPEPNEVPGPQCWCGRTGCIETWVSGPGLGADHARVAGEDLPAETIAARAGGGCARCAETLSRHAGRLARGLATVVNLLDPDAIVLGGGLSNVAPLYERLPERLAPYVFSDRVEIAILAPHHGDSSGVRGAAWLWSPEELDSAVPRPPRRRAP